MNHCKKAVLALDTSFGQVQWSTMSRRAVARGFSLMPMFDFFQVKLMAPDTLRIEVEGQRMPDIDHTDGIPGVHTLLELIQSKFWPFVDDVRISAGDRTCSRGTGQPQNMIRGASTHRRSNSPA